MNKAKKTIVAVITSSGLMLISGGAHAYACATTASLGPAAVAQVVTAVTPLTAAVPSATMVLIEAFWLAVAKPTIDMAATSIKAEISKQGTLKTTSDGILADARAIQDYKDKVDDVKEKIDAPGLGRACKNMASVSAQKQASEVSRATAVTGALKAFTKTSGVVSAERGAVDSYENSMSKYCTKNDIATGQCKTKTAPNELAGADMQATTLFGSVGSAKPSDTYSAPGQEAAADEFIRRVVSPSPPEMLPSACKTTQCKLFEDSRRSYLAVSSLTSNSLHEIKSMHTPQTGLGVATGTAALTGKKDLSMLEAINSYVNQKFSPEAIRTNAVATRPEIILRDIAQTQSFRLWLDYNNLRQLERIESLLAAQVSIDADRYMKPMLDAKRTEAVRSMASGVLKK